MDVRIFCGGLLLSAGLIVVACDGDGSRRPGAYTPSPDSTDDAQAIAGDEFLGVVAQAAQNAGNPA